METDLSSHRKEFESNLTQNFSSRTSFLIEDILYRQKVNQEEVSSSQIKQTDCNHEIQSPTSFKHTQVKYEGEKFYSTAKFMEKRQEKSGYGYFQPHLHSTLNGCVQNLQPPENGYIQVMGALGAYLGTPYKGISEHPYFLAQGNK